MTAHPLALLLTLLTPFSYAETAPEGNGQLEKAPRLFPGGTDADGRDFSYLGQPATNGKIILTASNGFFTNGVCKAVGESDLPKVGDDELIKPNFAFLDWRKTTGSLRWHFHIKNPGPVRLAVHLKVPADAAGAAINVAFAGQTKTVTSSKSEGKEAQPWDLTFDVKEPGEYLLSLSATMLASNRSGIGQLHRIDAFGAAMDDANLLRVRWRPAAVHGRYDTAKVKGVKLLVTTTRSVCDISSYSPITTPFGYYGTSFQANRRSNGNFNFSMWGKAGASTDLKMMPHLLGVGSPDGEFSGFGHEGSGVKARGWVPMPDLPEVCVQALRIEPGKLYDSYFGYYFDRPTKAWKFYCAGNKWHGGKSVNHLKVGSFCEVPGPPQSQRSGDIYREVRRRGWAYEDGKWIPLEGYFPGATGKGPVNKSWYTTKEGEYAMGCGGIRLYQYDAGKITSPAPAQTLPEFLTSPSVETLFAMPVQFGKIQASEVHPTEAILEIDIATEGVKDGAVYFGTKDALTFAPRKLHGTEKNSSLSQSVNDQVWQQMTPLTLTKVGINRVTLSELKPETTYYFRVLANNSVSRVWSESTLSFTTPKSGVATIKAPAR